MEKLQIKRNVKPGFYKELNANKRFCNAEVIDEVAEELDLPVELVKAVVEAQFKFVSQTIKAGGLETIILPYLGKFKVNPYQVQKLMANSIGL